MRYNGYTWRRRLSEQNAPDASLGLAEHKPSIGRFLIDAVETLVLATIIFVSIRILVRNFWIEGSSMEPNLHHGQYLFVTRYNYWLKSPQRGDIIVFSSPVVPERDLIKRVVGLPGEHVVIQDAQVFIDGAVLDEPYARPITYRGGAWTLRQDQVFVLGDNRSFSQDSHSWGPLEMEAIVGKAWLCYWPPSLWGLIPHHRFVQDGT
ncbi:MAG: signal peptidase I [Anaerolineae bacterium]|nr:signal peptidase I [Anaerolineae bacterium]